MGRRYPDSFFHGVGVLSLFSTLLPVWYGGCNRFRGIQGGWVGRGGGRLGVLDMGGWMDVPGIEREGRFSRLLCVFFSFSLLSFHCFLMGDPFRWSCFLLAGRGPRSRGGDVFVELVVYDLKGGGALLLAWGLWRRAPCSIYTALLSRLALIASRHPLLLPLICWPLLYSACLLLTCLTCTVALLVVVGGSDTME